MGVRAGEFIVLRLAGGIRGCRVYFPCVIGSEIISSDQGRWNGSSLKVGFSHTFSVMTLRDIHI